MRLSWVNFKASWVSQSSCRSCRSRSKRLSDTAEAARHARAAPSTRSSRRRQSVPSRSALLRMISRPPPPSTSRQHSTSRIFSRVGSPIGSGSRLIASGAVAGGRRSLLGSPLRSCCPRRSKSSRRPRLPQPPCARCGRGWRSTAPGDRRGGSGALRASPSTRLAPTSGAPAHAIAAPWRTRGPVQGRGRSGGSSSAEVQRTTGARLQARPIPGRPRPRGRRSSPCAP